MTGSIRSIDDVRRDLDDVLAQFRKHRGRAFSFGERGQPEAVLLSFDEYDDLGGPTKFTTRQLVAVDMVRADLPALVAASRDGELTEPVVLGEGTEPEAVIMSPSQYRHLRGDDEPPAGVVDDPTQRSYDTQPLTTSRPMTVDEFAAWLGPEAVRDLEEIRQERREA
jgi:hypothetical protein